MNIGQTSIVLRHRRTMEVFDLSLRFVRAVGSLGLARTCLYVLVPGYVGCLALHSFAGVRWPWIWLLAAAYLQLAELPVLAVVGRQLFDPEVRVADCLKDAFRRLPAFAASRFFVDVLGTISAIVPFAPLFVLGAYCFAPEAQVLERAGPLEALGRSKRFLRYRSGTGLEVLLVRWGVLIGAVLLFEMAGRELLGEGLDLTIEQDSLFQNGGSWYSLLGAFVVSPQLVVFRFLAYINERTRQDGWDVQVAFLGVMENAA